MSGPHVTERQAAMIGESAEMLEESAASEWIVALRAQLSELTPLCDEIKAFARRFGGDVAITVTPSLSTDGVLVVLGTAPGADELSDLIEARFGGRRVELFRRGTDAPIGTV